MRSEQEIRGFYERLKGKSCCGACTVWYDERGCAIFTHGVSQALVWVLGLIENVLEEVKE